VNDEPAVRQGLVAPEVAAEHPGLRLAWAEVEATPGPTPADLRKRLAAMADRIRGPDAIALRGREVPHLYRVFFRHVGLDPDRTRTPVEQLALERMKHGGFRSRSLLDDALTIATVESGVALRAFDADRLEGSPVLRGSSAGEGLEGRPGDLPVGTLVVADELRPIALVFGATGSGRGVRPRTRRTMLAATQVKGVPDIAVDEALWLAAEVMGSG
jgi:DNA/RNA-binding domain of Phe-tRNA-synthetase-like protein